MELSNGLIFPLVGTLTSLVMTGYYIYKIRDVGGLFSGSLDSYFGITINYAAVSGLLVTFFFMIFLLPSAFLTEIASGLYIADVVILGLTAVWAYLAYQLFDEIESMSQRYFTGGAE